VILINLLPHREAARKRRRETFYATLGLSAVLGGLIAVTAFLWFQAQISNQQAKNTLLKTEITKRETEIKEISTLQAESADSLLLVRDVPGRRQPHPSRSPDSMTFRMRVTRCRSHPAEPQAR